MKHKCGVKRILTRIICVFAVAALSTAILVYATFLFERKSSYHKLSPFFREKDNYDVIFLGNSHMINAILPMQLWDQYGIVSYNLGGHGAQLPTSYWVLRLALEHCQPGTVVIDCMALESKTKTSHIYSYVHQIMDQMPFGFTKLSAVADLLNDPNIQENPDGEERTALGLLWSFSVYHNRWDDLGTGDFAVTRNRQKGGEMKARFAKPKEFEPISENEVLKEETVGTEYLRKIIELCQEKGIQVMLTFLPFPPTEEDQRSANTMEKIAEEYNIPCVNFLKEEVIRYNTDMADADSHVNYSGAQKLTTWVGHYLRERLDVPNRREDLRYRAWDEDYQDYLGDAVKYTRDSKSLEEYLVMLTNPHNDVIIELYDRSIYRNETYVSLLQNLGIDPEDLADNADLIAVRGGRDATVCYSFKKDGVEVDTVLGRLSYRIEDRGDDGSIPYYVISTDGKELFAIPRSANGHTDLRVHIYEHDTGRLLLHSSIVLKSQKDFGEDYIELVQIENVT